MKDAKSDCRNAGGDEVVEILGITVDMNMGTRGERASYTYSW